MLFRAVVLAAALAAAAAICSAIALDRISAASLRANITWLAADQRKGRMSPSAGLDASADYLAGQFRNAELQPAGPAGSFLQTAYFSTVTQSPAGFRMTLVAGGTRPTNIAFGSVRIRSVAALEYTNEAVVRLPDTGDVTGHVVVGGASYATEAALYSLERRKPALILLLIDGAAAPDDNPPLLLDTDPSRPPIIRIYGRSLPRGREVRLTLHTAAPVRHDVTLRNVAGILRGSDASLRDQFVILSAHYDHLGMKPPRVFHGANDNASGAASLVEIAKALGTDPHPKRSILFLALFGEEEGLLGSAYYVRHPLVPLAKTVADVNLEQLGRTDTSDGMEVAKFAFTGPSYSNLPQAMSAATTLAGTSVYRKETADDYFDRSDNYSFALAGIVAHTVVVAFEFADYHEVGDTAAKIDYGNLAKVDQGIAAGVAAVANSAEAPKWSDTKAARVFRDAGH